MTYTPNKYHLLIDGDAIVYQAAAHLSVWHLPLEVDYFFHTRKEAIDFAGGILMMEKVGTYSPCKEVVFLKAIWCIENIVQNWTRRGDKPTFTVYLSTENDRDNFRLKIYPDYKANRKDVKKPRFYREVRGMLQIKYDNKLAVGEEADDSIAIDHIANWNEENKDRVTVVVSRDKDFKTLPGLYHDAYHNITHNISLLEAERFFYTQILMGDKADNIPGLKGIGPVKAAKLLKDIQDPGEMCSIVSQMYKEHAAKGREDMLMAGRLLRLRHISNEPLWEIPI